MLGQQNARQNTHKASTFHVEFSRIVITTLNNGEITRVNQGNKPNASNYWRAGVRNVPKFAGKVYVNIVIKTRLTSDRISQV